MESQPESDLLTALLSYKTADSLPPELISKLISYDNIFSFESSFKSPITHASLLAKLSIFYSIHPEITSYISSKSLKSSVFYYDLWKFYLPFALHLNESFKKSQKPLIQGIVGVQGAGKTTFTEVIVLILQHLNLKVSAISIDDFYKTFAEREIIRQKDPRFKWRGPPGTHDLETAIDLVKAIKSQKSPYSFPIFDKSLHHGEGDRIKDLIVEKVDILLFEGWFVGMRPMEKGYFMENQALSCEEDRRFAEDISGILGGYCELWDLLDDLIVLWPEDVDFSKSWRVEAEEKMKGQGKEGKSTGEINEFVDYFWRAVNPKIYIEELIRKKGASFKFNFNVGHELTKIERFLY